MASAEQKRRAQTKAAFSIVSQIACRAPSQRCRIFSSGKRQQACSTPPSKVAKGQEPLEGLDCRLILPSPFCAPRLVVPLGADGCGSDTTPRQIPESWPCG